MGLGVCSGRKPLRARDPRAGEADVLVPLAAGMRTKDFGNRMSRSPRTIDHHLLAIYGKLGVAGRAEAVSRAHRLGLLPARASSNAS